MSKRRQRSRLARRAAPFTVVRMLLGRSSIYLQPRPSAAICAPRRLPREERIGNGALQRSLVETLSTPSKKIESTPQTDDYCGRALDVAAIRPASTTFRSGSGTLWQFALLPFLRFQRVSSIGLRFASRR